MCRLLGAADIYFAGLDLSYTKNQTHIKGSSAEQSFHTKADRMGTLEKQSAGTMFSANPEYSTDYNGNKVLTDARMKMFAWWFESTIAATKGVKTYTLCPQSMKIPGIELASVEDVLKADRTSAVTLGPQQRPTVQVPQPASKQTFTELQKSFTDEIQNLTALINQAVEKCIISGPNLKSELSSIEQAIAESPLGQIIALARPVNEGPEEIYKTLQKTMGIYHKYVIQYNTEQ